MEETQKPKKQIDPKMIPYQFQKGQNGNHRKGKISWQKIVKRVLADEKIIDKVLKKKPAYWDELPQKNAAYAISVVMVIKALQGDHKAANWLRKTGFGDKFVVESEDSFFSTGQLTINVVNPETGKIDTGVVQPRIED